MFVIFFSVSVVCVNAESINEDNNEVKVSVLKEEKAFKSDSVLEEIGEMHYSYVLAIDNKEIALYPTFKNSRTALMKIKEHCNASLRKIYEAYNLKELSFDNWYDIYSVLGDFEGVINDEYQENKLSDEEYKILSRDIVNLNMFFDIYENEFQNENIISLSNRCNSNLKENDSVKAYHYLSLAIDELPEIEFDSNELLNYSSKILKTTQSESTTQSCPGNEKFSVTKGVAYADKYATKTNYVDFGRCDAGDCTNFTSQIKYRGGVPKYKKYGEKGAWSYQMDYSVNKPIFKYSVRWCRASSFVKFFERKYTYKTSSYGNKRTAFIKFSNAVKKGSFIAFDKTNDGDFDHNAFVSHVHHKGEDKRRPIEYHGKTYLDFKVAQHSNDYNAWVSAGKNSWEKLPYEYPKVVFAIVK